MKIDPASAKSMLEANLANIAAKLTAGGTLTASEQKRLEDAARATPAAPTPAPSASGAPAPPTPPAPEPTGPVGPADIARHWTAHGYPCSRQYASKCVTKLGCPSDSLAAALRWRQSRGAPKPSAGATPPTGNTSTDTLLLGLSAPSASSTAAPGTPPHPASSASAPASPPPAAILGNSLEALLARARQAEVLQYQAYQLAVTSGDPGSQSVALKNHNAAQKNLIEVEALILAAKKERGEFVDLEKAQQRIDDRLASLKTVRPQLARLLALALFPDAPHRAQPRIELELCRIMDPAVRTAEKRLIDGSAPLAPPVALAPAAA